MDLRPVDPETIQDKPDKGLQGGSCNRKICQQPGAFFYNKETRKFYCHRCCKEISKYNEGDSLFPNYKEEHEEYKEWREGQY